MNTSLVSLLSNVHLDQPYDSALLEWVEQTLDGRAMVASLEPTQELYRPWSQDETTALVTNTHDTPQLLAPLREGYMRLMIERWELYALVLLLDLKLSRFATLVQRAFPGACETLFQDLGVTTHHKCSPLEAGGPKRPLLRLV
jgi:hypothetical protein